MSGWNCGQCKGWNQDKRDACVFCNRMRHTDEYIPVGPSRAEAIRVAVAAERARWVAAMDAVVVEIQRRGQEIAPTAEGSDAIDKEDSLYAQGEEHAYGGCVEALQYAIARAKEAP